MTPRQRKTLLLLFSILLAFLIAEGFSRLYLNRQIKALTFSESDQYYYYEPNGFRRHIPNKVGYERLWDGSGKAEFRINNVGLRGPDLTDDKPDDVYRILFLGDSVTFGVRLHEKDIFIRQIEERLNKNSFRRIEVINGAKGDIGLIEMESLLSEVGLSLQPDLVVLCWYMNDNRPPVGFREEKIYQNPLIRWFNQNTWFQKSSFLSLSYYRLQQYLVKKEVSVFQSKSRRFDWVDIYNETKAWVNDPTVFKHLISSAQYDWGDAWKEESLIESAKGIARIRNTVEKAGGAFLLGITPVHVQLYAEFEDPFIQLPQRALLAFAAKEKIPTLDLIPVLSPHINKDIFYDQCHYTPLGNQIVAEGFVRFIREHVPFFQPS